MVGQTATTAQRIRTWQPARFDHVACRNPSGPTAPDGLQEACGQPETAIQDLLPSCGLTGDGVHCGACCGARCVVFPPACHGRGRDTPNASVRTDARLYRCEERLNGAEAKRGVGATTVQGYLVRPRWRRRVTAWASPLPRPCGRRGLHHALPSTPIRKLCRPTRPEDQDIRRHEKQYSGHDATRCHRLPGICAQPRVSAASWLLLILLQGGLTMCEPCGPPTPICTSTSCPRERSQTYEYG